MKEKIEATVGAAMMRVFGVAGAVFMALIKDFMGNPGLWLVMLALSIFSVVAALQGMWALFGIAVGTLLALVIVSLWCILR